jgi:hypothetical protein
VSFFVYQGPYLSFLKNKKGDLQMQKEIILTDYLILGNIYDDSDDPQCLISEEELCRQEVYMLLNEFNYLNINRTFVKSVGKDYVNNIKKFTINITKLFENEPDIYYLARMKNSNKTQFDKIFKKYAPGTIYEAEERRLNDEFLCCLEW